MVKIMCLLGCEIFPFSTTIKYFHILLKNQRPCLMPVSLRGIHIELGSHLQSWLPGVLGKLHCISARIQGPHQLSNGTVVSILGIGHCRNHEMHFSTLFSTQDIHALPSINCHYLFHLVAICRDMSLGYSLKTWCPQLSTVFQMGSDQAAILTTLFSLFEAFLVWVSHPTWHEWS